MLRGFAALAAVVLSAFSVCAWAHVESPAGREAGERFLIALLAVAGAWYAVGYRRVRRASAGGREVLLRRALSFVSGWSILAASLLSPLHALGGRSFTAHMIEHELLMLAAAPLIAWSKPIGVLLWALPRTLRQALGALGHRGWFSAVWRRISRPLTASLIQAALLWIWHAPELFDRALQNESWHAAQHLSLLFSALLFWWSVDRVSSLERNHGAAAFFLFFTSVHSALLGALMAFADSPWYAQYAAMGLSGTSGLTPLEDQQLAGLIMWVPGGAFHVAVALVYLARLFRRRAAGFSAVAEP